MPDYGQIIDDLDKQTTPNKYGDIIDGISNATIKAPILNAETAKEVTDLSRQSGDNAIVIQNNLDAYRKRKQELDLSDFMAFNPAMGAWLEQSPHNKSLVQDDHEGLTALESLVKTAIAIPRALASAPATFGASIYSIGEEAAGLLPEFIGGGARGIFHQLRTEAEQTAQNIRGDNRDLPRVVQVGLSAVESISQQLPGIVAGIITGNPAVALTILGTQTAGQSFGQALDKGLSPSRALSFGVLQGQIEVLTELIPVSRLLKDVGAKATLFNTIKGQLFTEIPGEQVATLFQDLNEWASLNPDKPFSAYVKERPSAAADTLVATVVATVGMGTAGHFTGKIVDRLQAKADKDFILALGDNSANSKIRERSPETRQEIVRHLTQEGVKEVFIPKDSWDSYWRDQNADPREVANEMFGDTTTYDNAPDDIIVPLDVYDRKIAPTEHNKFFADVLRTTAEGMSAKQAEEDFKSIKLEDIIAEEPVQPLTPADTQESIDVVDAVVGGQTLEEIAKPQEALPSNVEGSLASLAIFKGKKFTADVNKLIKKEEKSIAKAKAIDSTAPSETNKLKTLRRLSEIQDTLNSGIPQKAEIALMTEASALLGSSELKGVKGLSQLEPISLGSGLQSTKATSRMAIISSVLRDSRLQRLLKRGGTKNLKGKLKKTVDKIRTISKKLKKGKNIKGKAISTEDRILLMDKIEELLISDVLQVKDVLLGNPDVKRIVRKVSETKATTTSVKKQISISTGMLKAVNLVREDKALNATFKKAEQNSKIAFREGRKEEALVWKDKMNEVMQEARAKVERNRIVKSIKNIQRINKKSKIDVGFKKRIDSLLSGLDLKKLSAKKHEKLQSLANYIAEHGTPLGISPKKVSELKRLSKIPAEDLTLPQLRRVLHELKKLRKQGLLKAKLSRISEKRKLNKNIDKLIDSTVNLDVAPVKTKHATKVGKTRRDLFYTGMRSAYLETLHTFRVADLMDGRQNYKGENVKILQKHNKGEQNYHDAHVERLGVFLNKYGELFGNTEITQKELEAVSIHGRYEEGSFEAVNTLMDFYGYSVPEGTIIHNSKQLEEHVPLTDNARKLVKLVREVITAKTDEVAALHEQLTGEPFVFVDNYFAPLLYVKGEDIGPRELIRHDFKEIGGRTGFVKRKRHANRNFTKERVPGVKKIPNINILDIVDKAISSQEWYLNVEPVLAETSSLTSSKRYREVAGRKASRWWDDQIEIMANRGWKSNIEHNGFTRWLKFTRGNLNRAVLLFKASTVMMQPFAVFDALAYAQAKYGTRATANIVSEFGKTWFKPKYANQIIEASQALRQRQGGEVALEEVLQEASKSDKVWGKIERLGASFILKADVKTAAGVRQGFLKTLERIGAENPEAEADFLMNLTQGSSNIAYRPHVLSKGEGYKTIFTFQTFFLNRWGLIAKDLLGGVKDKGFKRKLASLIGLGILMLGGFVEDFARSVIAKLEKKPVQDKDTGDIVKDVIFYLPEQIPVAGNFVESARRGFGGGDVPVTSVARKLAQGLAVDMPNGRFFKGASRTGEATATLLFGVPGTAQAFDILDAMVESQ